MGVAAVFMVLYGLLGRQMLYVLTSDHDVVAASMEFILWLVPMPVVGCAAFTWDGIYVGATASKPIRNSSIWAVIASLSPTNDKSRIRQSEIHQSYWFFGGSMSENPSIVVHVLMAAFLFHLFIRMAYETVLYRRSILGAIR